jgi:parvulin-like peptidyl-prolyl isomerase
MRLVLVILVLCQLYSQLVFAAEVIPTETAVVVNGVIITTAEYRGELARLLRQRKKVLQELDPASRAITGKEAMETLISRELLYQESVRNGLIVNEADVATEISGVQARFPSEEQFIESLKKLDLSRDALAVQIHRGKAIQALIDTRFGKRVPASENEMRTYYDIHRESYAQPVQIRLSHILVKPVTVVSGNGNSSPRARVDELYRRINSGEDFAVVARESDDAASNAKGGDLGYFKPGELEKGLEATAFALSAGQVGAVVEDRFGLHILKVTERRPKSYPPFEEIREQIAGQIKQERLLADLAPYIKKLRDAARIEIHLSGE